MSVHGSPYGVPLGLGANVGNVWLRFYEEWRAVVGWNRYVLYGCPGQMPDDDRLIKVH